MFNGRSLIHCGLLLILALPLPAVGQEHGDGGKPRPAEEARRHEEGRKADDTRLADQRAAIETAKHDDIKRANPKAFEDAAALQQKYGIRPVEVNGEPMAGSLPAKPLGSGGTPARGRSKYRPIPPKK